MKVRKGSLAGTIIIVLFAGLIALVLSLYDYRNTMLQEAEDRILFNELIGNVHLISELDPGDDPSHFEFKVISGFVENSGDYPGLIAAWLYDPASGRISDIEGNPYAAERPELFYDRRPDERIAGKLRRGEEIKYTVIDRCQYCRFKAGDYYLIALHDIRGTLEAASAKQAEVIRANAVFTALVILLLIFLSRLPKERSRRICSGLLIFAWVLLFSSAAAVDAYRRGAEGRAEIVSGVYSDIELDLSEIALMSDADANTYLALLPGGDPPEAEDPRLYFARSIVKYYEMEDRIPEITLNDNALDTSLPVEERAEVRWTNNETQRLAEALLRSFMCAIFALVLYYELTVRAGNIVKGSDSYPEVGRLKAVLLLQSIAAGLISSVAVMVLKERAVRQGLNISHVILALSLFDLLIPPWMEYLEKWSSSRRQELQRETLVFITVLAAGAALCGASQRLLPYCAGYLLVLLGNNMRKAFRDSFSGIKGSTPEANDAKEELVVSQQAGTVIGLILAGILSGVVTMRSVFIFACMIALSSLLFERGLTVKVEKTLTPPEMRLSVLLRDRELRGFMLCVIVTGGVVTYFYRYALPLCAAELGYSSAVISFIYLLTSAGTYLTKTLRLRVFRPSRVGQDDALLIYILGNSAAIFIMLRFPSMAAFAAGGLLLGIVGSVFGNVVKTGTAGVLKKRNYGSSCNFIYDTGNQSGKLLVSALVNLGLSSAPLLGMPTLIAAAYALLAKRKK